MGLFATLALPSLCQAMTIARPPHFRNALILVSFAEPGPMCPLAAQFSDNMLPSVLLCTTHCIAVPCLFLHPMLHAADSLGKNSVTIRRAQLGDTTGKAGIHTSAFDDTPGTVVIVPLSRPKKASSPASTAISAIIRAAKEYVWSRNNYIMHMNG